MGERPVDRFDTLLEHAVVYKEPSGTVLFTSDDAVKIPGAVGGIYGYSSKNHVDLVSNYEVVTSENTAGIVLDGSLVL